MAVSFVKDFLEQHTCYDLLPVNNKVVVVDVELSLKKALQILLQNDLQGATLWDSHSRQIVGMLTATDFINLAIHYHYKYKNDVEGALKHISSSNIKDLRDVLNSKITSELIKLEPDDSLLQSSMAFVQHGVHNIILIHEHELLSLMDRDVLLKFIAVNLDFGHGDVSAAGHVERIMAKSIKDLGLGVWHDDVISVKVDTPLISVLELFADKKISSIPIIDESGHLLDVCEKIDIIDTMVTGIEGYLDKSIVDFISKRRTVESAMHVCVSDTPLMMIMDGVRSSKEIIKRFFIVEKETGSTKRLIGVLSTSDVLKFLINF